ncbi:GspH/FimT family pseudopilin [Dyella nitratireducens]|uniref:GspH/FimT family pseudopilin n=1 Tax=Dyella nitratireducens TaxID=1849580 RepID=UPI003C3022C2
MFCPSRDGLHCSGDDSWGQGWLIGKADLNDDGQLLGLPRYTGRKYRDTLIIISNIKQKYVWFGPDGSAKNTWPSLSFCVKGDPQHLLKVIISRTGRIRGDVEKNPAASPCSTSA